MTKKSRGVLAHSMLHAARQAASLQCRQETEQLAQCANTLQGHTFAMLGLPCVGDLPSGDVKELVKTSGELALLLRAYNWAAHEINDANLLTGESPHAGERGVSESFDALGKLILPNASAEGWASELITRAAEGNESLEAVAKIGKYLLHAGPGIILDDVTKIVGAGVHGWNVKRLTECVRRIGDIWTRNASPEVLQLHGLKPSPNITRSGDPGHISAPGRRSSGGIGGIR